MAGLFPAPPRRSFRSSSDSSWKKDWMDAKESMGTGSERNIWFPLKCSVVVPFSFRVAHRHVDDDDDDDDEGV